MFYGEIIQQASILIRGKHKPIYHRTKWYLGDNVIIVNAEKIIMPGDRLKTKEVIYHTGYPGHLQRPKFKDLVFKKPEYLFYRGVYKNLPRNLLRFRLMEKVHVYSGPTPRLHSFLPSVK